MDVAAGIPLCFAEDQAASTKLRGLLKQLTQDTPSNLQLVPKNSDWPRFTPYINEHLHSLPDAAGLAKKAGYTRIHFSRRFKERTGPSPQQYVIDARIALARELLRATTLTIEEVAH